MPIIGRQFHRGPTVAREVTTKVFRNPFRFILEPDILPLLALISVVFAIFYGINAPTSSLFSAAYPFLSETEIGFCYLPIGGGMAMASSIMGRIFDFEYQTFRRREEARITALGLTTTDITKEDFFPLEEVRFRTLPFFLTDALIKARLRLLPFFTFLLVSSCAGYGWTIQRQTNIAYPLILQFIGDIFFLCNSYCFLNLLNLLT